MTKNLKHEIMIYKYNNETLDFEKVNLKKYVALMLFIFFSLGFGASETKRVIVQGEKEINLITENSFSKEKLLKEIEKYNFRYPEIVYAQAVLESGNFSSNIFLENNNLFGMKEAGSRVTKSTGTANSHASYDNWKDSIADRALFEAAYLRGLSESEYFLFLKNNYAEVKDYDILIKNLITKRQAKKRIKTV